MTSNQFEVEIKYRLALLILYDLLDEWSFILPLSPNQTFSYLYLMFSQFDISFSNLFQKDTKNGKESSVRIQIEEKNAKIGFKTTNKVLKPLFLLVSKLIWLNALWGVFVIKQQPFAPYQNFFQQYFFINSNISPLSLSS